MTRAVLLLAALVSSSCLTEQELGTLPGCAPGSMRSCAPTRPGCVSCDGAIERCDASGRWSTCSVPGRSPVFELCGNGCDDDCNGLVDDCARCREPTETRACYAGPAGTLDLGRCRLGAQRCDPLTQGFRGVCDSEAPAVVERCGNRVDDDCDGAVDEGCATPRVLGVAVGDLASCALLRGDEGSVLACWGSATSGIFGEDRGRARLRPERVVVPSDAVAIAMGAEHVCVVTRVGEVWCVGRNDAGQLGDASLVDRTAAVRVAGVDDVAAVSAGRFHTCALRRDGAVSCWGSDRVGQCGAQEAGVPCARGGARGCHTVPRGVVGLSPASAIGTGFEHGCARIADGSVRCWGDPRAFDEATLTTTAREVLPAGRAEVLVVGGASTCALRRDGDVMRPECLGAARSLAERAFGGGLTAMSLGAPCCAVTPPRRLRCSSAPWWDDPATPPKLSPMEELPVSFEAPGAVTSMAVGISHACLVIDGGSVRCWGGAASNRDGQLGTGAQTVENLPTREVLW